MKRVPHRISRASLVKVSKTWATQQHIEIFGAICSVDQLEIMQAGILQAETATVMMVFDEEVQTTSTPPAGELLIWICNGKTLTLCQLNLSHGLV